MLDELERGVAELGDMAATMRGQIEVGMAVYHGFATKLETVTPRLRGANRALDEIIDESGGASRWCPILVCLIRWH